MKTVTKDICVRESYQDSQGNDVVSWNKIGYFIDKGEKQYIKLYHMPNVLCSVFERREKDAESQGESVGF